MDWNDIQVFLALVRTGTLGGAARRLGLSHPTIGRRLQALEKATGQALFQRTSDGFVLTQEGSSVLALAEQIEDAALAVERRLAGAEGLLDGTLRVSTSDWFAAWMLPTVVEEFSSRYPSVKLELLTGSRLFSLSHREADLAFRVVPFDETDIVQRRLFSIAFAAYASVGVTVQPETGGSGLRLIEDAPTETYPNVGWLKQQLPEAEVVLRSNNRTVQARMCAAGVGVAVLPRAIGDAMPSLRLVDLPEAPPSRDIWMGYHRDLRTLHRLRAFVDLAVERLTGSTVST